MTLIDQIIPKFSFVIVPLAKSLEASKWTPYRLRQVDLLSATIFSLLLYGFGQFSTFLFLVPLCVLTHLVLSNVALLLEKNDLNSPKTSTQRIENVVIETLMYLPLAALTDSIFQTDLMVLILVSALIREIILLTQDKEEVVQEVFGSSERLVVFGLIGVLAGMEILNAVWTFIILAMIVAWTVYSAIRMIRPQNLNLEKTDDASIDPVNPSSDEEEEVSEEDLPQN